MSILIHSKTKKKKTFRRKGLVRILFTCRPVMGVEIIWFARRWYSSPEDKSCRIKSGVSDSVIRKLLKGCERLKLIRYRERLVDELDCLHHIEVSSQFPPNFSNQTCGIRLDIKCGPVLISWRARYNSCGLMQYHCVTLFKTDSWYSGPSTCHIEIQSVWGSEGRAVVSRSAVPASLPLSQVVSLGKMLNLKLHP